LSMTFEQKEGWYMKQITIEELKELREEYQKEHTDVYLLIKKHEERPEYRSVMDQLKGKIDLINELIETHEEAEHEH